MRYDSNPNQGPGMVIPPISLWSNDEIQKLPLGTRFQMGGRTFHYAKAGGTALQPGYLVQGPALGGATTTLQGTCAVTATIPAGSKSLTLTAITTAQAANLFNEGFATIFEATNSVIFTLRVKTNTAFTTTTAGTLTFYDEIPVALDTSDKVALVVEPFKSLIVVPTTTPTAFIYGGPVTTITALYYGFIQTWGLYGVANIDNSTNITVSSISPGTSTTGSALSGAGNTAFQVMGSSVGLFLDSYSAIVNLTCVP